MVSIHNQVIVKIGEPAYTPRQLSEILSSMGHTRICGKLVQDNTRIEYIRAIVARNIGDLCLDLDKLDISMRGDTKYLIPASKCGEVAAKVGVEGIVLKEHVLETARSLGYENS